MFPEVSKLKLSSGLTASQNLNLLEKLHQSYSYGQFCLGEWAVSQSSQEIALNQAICVQKKVSVFALQ
jgi:hypothetical protein